MKALIDHYRNVTEIISPLVERLHCEYIQLSGGTITRLVTWTIGLLGKAGVSPDRDNRKQKRKDIYVRGRTVFAGKGYLLL